MVINFSGTHALAADGGIYFQAVVDGQNVDCHVTHEALSDHFPSSSTESSYVIGRLRIEEIAESKIRANAQAPIMVLTADP
ncbi:DUF1488 domain-containing protein [Herbaspirillum sp. RU 5E]|nr:DUF1488 domain-containing protein [Herbaspirillum sp. RU 5E]